MILFQKWGDEMTTSEAAKKLFELTEENAKLKAALDMLKFLNCKAKKEDRTYAITCEEADALLNVAGLAEREIKGICFDNSPEDIAYES